MSDEKVYTATEAAELLGVTPATITRYIRIGKIQAKMVFGKWRIKESAIKPYLELLK